MRTRVDLFLRKFGVMLMSAVCLAAATAVPAAEQNAATGQIRGKITDKSGAVVPHTKLVFTNSQTQLQTTARSNDHGRYSVDLKSGAYTLSAEAAGFKKYQRKAVAIKPGLVATLDITLEVGKATQAGPADDTRVRYEKDTSAWQAAVPAPDQPQLLVQLGYSNGVTSVVFSPDGRLVLAGSQDKTARLWETATGREVRRFVDPEDEVKSVAFSADGHFVLTESDRNDSVRIWNAATGEEVQHFEEGSSTQGRSLLTTESKVFSIVRDAASGKELYRFETQENHRSPDGRFLLTSENVTDNRGPRHFVSMRDPRTRREVRRFEGHSDLISSMAFSPDGRLLLTGSQDKTARLWAVATGKELRRLEGHAWAINSVAFSPDGSLVVTGSDDKTARLWETATGRPVRCFCEQPGPVRSVAFSADGRTVLTGDPAFEEHRWTRLWNRSTGKAVQQFRKAASPDGRMLLQEHGEHRLLTVRDKATGRQLCRFELQSASQAFSPDGRLVVKTDRKNAILQDVATGKELRTFKGHAEDINAVAFSPDGRFVLTGSGYQSYKDNTVRLWDAATGQELRRFEGNSTLPVSVSFSPDGRSLAIEGGVYDSSVGPMGGGGVVLGPAYLWDLATGQQTRNVPGGLLDMTCAAYSPDGRFVLTGRWEIAQLWDAATGQEVQRFARHSSWVRAVAFSPDGRLVLTGSSDNTARLWDTITGREVQRFLGHSDVVTEVGFSPDGHLVATASYDRSVRVWDPDTGKEVQRFEGLVPVAFSSDGLLLVTDKAYNPILKDPATGKEVRRLVGHRVSIDSAAFSSDRRWLLTGGSDYIVRLWDLATGNEVRQFEGHKSTVHAIAFSADGHWALTGSGDVMQDVDMTVRLWDVATGKEIRRFGDSKLPAFSVGFSPDGQSVFAYTFKVYGGDETGLLGRGIVQLWDATTGEQRRRVGELSPRGRAAFSPDGNLLLEGRQNASVLLDAATGAELRRFNGYPSAISPDNHLVVTGNKHLDLTLWDATTGQQVRNFHDEGSNKAITRGKSRNDEDDEAEESMTALVVSSDGRLVATGTSQGVLRLWETATGEKKQDFKANEKSPGSVKSIGFSPDGRFMVTTSTSDPDTNARLWDVATGKQIRRFAMDDDNDERYNVTAVALSLDGRLGLTWGFSSGINQMVFEGANTPRLWDATSEKNREIGRLTGHSDDVFAAAFSPDARFVVTGSKDGTTRLWETATGRELCRLISFRDGSWVVVDSQGRFDTNNLEEVSGLHWIFPDDPFKPLPLEIFMREYYEPRLLQRILAGERFRSVRPLASLNKVQPQVKITSIEPQANSTDTVAVTVEVAGVSEKSRRKGREMTQESGVYDLRLYRNNQLVNVEPAGSGDYQAFATMRSRGDPEEELEIWRRISAVKLDAMGRARRRFVVRLQHKAGLRYVQFSAYAFNSDRVKSTTDRKLYLLPRSLASAQGKAYVITVGVARNENSRWSLLYPANDAHLLRDVLTDALGKTGQYREVVPIVLVSSHEDSEADELLPTKANLHTVLDLLAARSVASRRLAGIPAALREKLQPVRPDDLVVIAFSGHGNTDAHEAFYLYPYDLGVEEPILSQRLIASEELAGWLRTIDAADVVMILDACRSGAAPGAGFRPGPMGDRGLGQLAYDKGMRILAAAPSDKDTLSIGRLHHGLLTYALAHDGLQMGLALQKNEPFELGEWLRYGAKRVPELFLNMVGSGLQGEVPHPAVFDFVRGRALAAPDVQ